MIIRKITNHIYEYISYLNTEDYGKVGCNVMLIINENKGIVFDTPTVKKSSLELIDFVTNNLKTEIIGIIPTHFHEDCVGGIAAFENYNIQTYASSLILKLLNDNGQVFSKPVKELNTIQTFKIGNKKVYTEYFGEGQDISPQTMLYLEVVWLKKLEQVKKGYLGDANTDKWSETVLKIKLKYPKTKIVIPGHGKSGGTELFDYTIELFESK